MAAASPKRTPAKAASPKKSPKSAKAASPKKSPKSAKGSPKKSPKKSPVKSAKKAPKSPKSPKSVKKDIKKEKKEKKGTADKVKDPNAPKRAMTAYFFFLGENRAKIIADYKLDAGKVAEIAKKGGEVWGKMSDAEKAPYIAKNEADKQRYEREIANYTPDESAFVTKKGTKAKKDKDAPKRGMSGYFFFLGQSRAKIIADYKLDAGKVAEVAKKAGEVWGKMSEAEKQPFQDLAVKDKARYEAAMAAYEKA